MNPVKRIWTNPRSAINYALANQLDFSIFLIPFTHGVVAAGLILTFQYLVGPVTGPVASVIAGLLVTFFLLWVFAPLVILASRLLGVRPLLAELQLALSWAYLPFAVVSVAWLAFIGLARALGFGYWNFDELGSWSSATAVEDAVLCGLGLLWILLAAVAVSAAQRSTFSRGLFATLLAVGIVSVPFWFSPPWPALP